MKDWICALAIVLACAQPTCTKAYFFKYVPPQPPAWRQKNPVAIIKVNPTGYYGPLKGQKKYTTGNYRKEVRLNGAGKITSSGKKPAIGMIAADTIHYPYGTIVRIKETGFICKVEDTGPAIKGRRRIDIFCGWGDKGRKIASTWSKDQQVTMEILYVPKKKKV